MYNTCDKHNSLAQKTGMGWELRVGGGAGVGGGGGEQGHGTFVYIYVYYILS